MSVAQRVKRVDSVAKFVLATYVDMPQLKAYGYTYFVGNKKLAIDALTVVDCLQS